MRVVVDTNVVISAFLKANSLPAQILNLLRDGKIEIITSPAIIAEVERVLQYPKLRNHYSYTEADIEALLTVLRVDTTLVEPEFTLDVVQEDESDNRFLEAAVTGKASCVITGDNHLLQHQSYSGIQIITPVTFLQMMSAKRMVQ